MRAEPIASPFAWDVHSDYELPEALRMTRAEVAPNTTREVEALGYVGSE